MIISAVSKNHPRFSKGKFTLYMGLNDKDTKKQEISTEEAYKYVSKILVENCGGGTIYEARGVYTHDDTTVVEERTLRIEIMFTAKEVINDIIRKLKNAFNQESIIVQSEAVRSELC